VAECLDLNSDVDDFARPECQSRHIAEMPKQNNSK
jgi:hypothetical protein